MERLGTGCVSLRFLAEANAGGGAGRGRGLKRGMVQLFGPHPVPGFPCWVSASWHSLGEWEGDSEGGDVGMGVAKCNVIIDEVTTKSQPDDFHLHGAGAL